MYNLNMNGPGGSGLLSLPLPQCENSTTPRTPEIVNSLIAMTNPFESSYRAHAPRMASSPPGGSDASNSSSGSGGGMSPPSVQHTCSQLIKEGLKLTIQSKRRHALPGHETKTPRTDEVSGSGCSGGYDDDDGPFSPGDGLTPEDEERRRRRRERNKIAATKCRLKKRERTVNLVHESEILENQNHDLKSQIQELETQRRRLVDMLSVHGPSCTRHPPQTFNPTPTPSPFQTFPRPHPSPTPSSQANRMGVNYPRPPVDATMTYRRVETCVEPYRRMETVVEETSYCRGPLEATVYQQQHYDPTEAKDILTPYTRAALQTVESPPSFTRIADQYSCQNLTDLDQFVKPELPSMAGFHSPASTFSVDGSPVLTNNVSYHQFEDESDSFLDRSCMA